MAPRKQKGRSISLPNLAAEVQKPGYFAIISLPYAGEGHLAESVALGGAIPWPVTV